MTADTSSPTKTTTSIASSEPDTPTPSSPNQSWAFQNLFSPNSIHPQRETVEKKSSSRRKKNQVEPTFFEGGKYEYELTRKPSTPSVAPPSHTSPDTSDSNLLIQDSGTAEISETRPTNPNITTHHFIIPRTNSATTSTANNNIPSSEPKQTKTISYTHNRKHKNKKKTNDKRDDSKTTKTPTYKRPLKVVLTTTMIPVTKTIYLIRHAESEENRRLACLTRGCKGLKKLQLPSKDDILGSLELLDVKAQIDSNVSDIGQNQISQLGERLSIADFAKEKHIQLVAHSPLKRARQTSLGMLGCVTATTEDSKSNDDFSSEGAKAPTVSRIVQLDILKERTPSEWLPHNFDGFTQRIASLETWLGEQPEEVIAIVGHSQYFKSMLGLDFKFGNCDVWEVQLDMTKIEDHDGVKEDVGVSPVEEKTMQIKEQLVKPFQKKDESEKKDEDNKSETDVKDESPDGSSILDYSHFELPRGWRDLKRLYTYNKPDDATSNEDAAEDNETEA